jgi:DNA polymerase IV
VFRECPLRAKTGPYSNAAWRHCESASNRGRTVTLKVKFSDFEIITRSRSVSSAVSDREDLAHLAISLLEDNMPLPKAVWLLGLSLSTLQGENVTQPQMDFGV